MKTDRLYYGAAYYDEYMPVSRIPEDMAMMKAAGINVIRIAESTWSTWEPVEGVFDFTRLHRMLQGAEAAGISVIVGTPTYAIPPWLARLHPDILAETSSGQERYGRRQNMDITNPVFLRYAERIIRRLLEEVRPYGHVIGFQIDNETKHYDVCGPRVRERFREYLKEKFGTVEALNRAFGFAYWSNSLGSWDDLPDVRGSINGSFRAEFEAFRRQLVTEYLHWQRSIVDEYRRPDQFVTHNFDGEWKGYSYSLQPDVDQFRAAEALTAAGYDIYHPGAKKLTGTEISFHGDMARSLKNGENYFVLETQAQGQTGWLPLPGQLRLQAFSHLAGGANMVEYWHWHSIHNACESYWKGVLSHDFTPGAVYREACTVGADFARLSPRLRNLQRKGRAAIVVSNRSLTGMRFSAAFAGPGYGEILRWLYDSLFRMNIPCDFVPDTVRSFDGYELVVTPGLYCAEEGLRDALRSYVASGGRLISSFRSFFCNEHAKIDTRPQPAGMTDVFGLTYDEFTVPDGVDGVSGWMELVRCEGAEVLEPYCPNDFGDYAMAAFHSWGAGSAAYIGAYTSAEKLDALMERILGTMGIALPSVRWPVTVRTGVNDSGNTITYLLNYSAEPQTVTPETSGSELLSGNRILPGAPITLPPWGVAILESEQ